jgi:hypothetical protein
MSVYYHHIRALIDPEQADLSADGSVHQDVSVIMIHDNGAVSHPALLREATIVTLSGAEAREFAFELLSLAEQAERIGGRR